MVARREASAASETPGNADPTNHRAPEGRQNVRGGASAAPPGRQFIVQAVPGFRFAPPLATFGRRSAAARRRAASLNPWLLSVTAPRMHKRKRGTEGGLMPRSRTPRMVRLPAPRSLDQVDLSNTGHERWVP